MNSWTVYSSNSFRVEANGAGTEITNLHTGFSRWLQGDESNDLQAAIEVVSARVPDAKVTEATDHYLSQYFDASDALCDGPADCDCGSEHRSNR